MVESPAKPAHLGLQPHVVGERIDCRVSGSGADVDSRLIGGPHYAAHVIYAVCQRPLLTLAILLLQRRRDRKNLLGAT